MKEDQDHRVSQNSRQSQQSRSNQDKPLFKAIGNTLTTTQSKKNRLIFMSKALPIIEPVAYSILDSLHQDKFRDNQIVLLVDFQNEEIEYLNQYLKNFLLTKPMRKDFDKQSRNRTKVQRLVNLTIEKRKACYIRDGVYAVTNQIFLTDLLRGQTTIHPQHISKIIVKLTEKVKNYYNYYGWLSTFLRIKQENDNNKWRVPIMFVCNQPQHYTFQDDLREVYRILFCDKVVIWPFGRAQIHKKLSQYRQNKKVKEWQHSLSHSQNQKNIQELLKQIYNFLKKTYGKKYGQSNMPLDDMMYSRVNEQSFQATRGQFNQFESIKILLSLLQNSNKISILNRMAYFTEKSDCALWNSNNNQIVELIQELTKNIKESIFLYEQSQSKMRVNLKQLIVSSEKRTGLISNLEQSDYECQVQLDIKLTLRLQENEKIMELIKVIETEKTNKKQQKSPTQDLQLKQFQEIIEKHQKLGQQPLQRLRTILVICNGKHAKKYITRTLQAYQRDNLYINYLLSLQHSLLAQSSVRLNKLRRIYERKKIKTGQNSTRESKISEIQKINQSKIMLEELLLFEIEKFKSLTNDFQLQLNILQHELANAEKQGTIFKINEEEASLIATFNQKLLKSNFHIIDITKIKVSNLIQNEPQDVYFESQTGKTKIVVTQFYRNSEISSFYDIMNRTNSEIVIFYSPNTHLTRSLYIYQIQSQNQNLQSIHIFSYEASYQTKCIQQEVIREDKAFWQISQKRSQLSQFNETPFIRVKNLNMRDSVDKSVRSINGKTLLRNEQKQNGFNLATVEFLQYRRKIIVDTRQFKSSLPAYLYYYGFQIIPMFLKNGDYILSDEIAVQKKSVNTRDLQNSLKSSRLDEQLRRLNSQFKQYYLLIEFQEQKDCRKQNFSGFQFTKNDREYSQSRELRKRLLQLITKYERVRLIWSTSVKQTCQFFKMIKMDHTQPDLLKFSKAEAEEEVESKSTILQNIVEVSARKQAGIEDLQINLS